MAAACENPEPLTCEDLGDIELESAQREFDKLCNAAGVNELVQLFFAPPWASDPDDQRAALVHYMTRHAICLPSNNKGTDCDPEAPCLDPQPTLCPDPEECPSKLYGYGALEVIRAAIRADSMTYLPIARLDDLAAGDALVWDPSAAADNAPCDSCIDNELGAFIPQSVYEAEHP